jgi:hypothetical protein
MRRLAFSACLFLVLPIAAPASGQIAGRHEYGPAPRANPFIGDSRLPPRGVGRQVHDMGERVRRARDNGFISRREARRLSREARAIEHMAARYGADGLSQSERDELELRAQALSGAINRAHGPG